MTLSCDNKGALRNAFRPIPAGITPYLHGDHDLIEVARSLLQLIPVWLLPLNGSQVITLV
jgi:hypothetical protein